MRYKNFVVVGIVVMLTAVLAFLMDTPPDEPILNITKNVIGILFLMYIPGYLFVDYLFGNKLKGLEKLVSSIGVSVSLTILIAMVIYFIGLKIEIVNILSLLLITVFILIPAHRFRLKRILSARSYPELLRKEKPKKREKTKNKIFYMHVLLAIVVIVVLSYLSAFLPSKEEFVELYWATSIVEGLQGTSEVRCAIDNCSLSGIYKSGKVGLDDKVFNIILNDLDKAGDYKSFCIDVDSDGEYCEGGEGPYRYYETFFVGSSGFTSLRFDEEKVVFVNYPEYVFVENFTTSFVIKSFYARKYEFNVTLSVNGDLQYSELLELEPAQETLTKVDIGLPTTGQYKIKVNIRPVALQDSATYIYFWVDRKM